MTKCLVIMLALASVATAPAMAATSITVANASFEVLPPDGLPNICGADCAFSYGASIPGWTTTGLAGQQQLGTVGFINYVPDGLTSAWSNAGTISQTVGVTAVAGTTYTLSTAFGVRNDLGNPGTTSLVVGANTVLATGIAPTPGNWATYTASYTATAADAGGAITIVLDSPAIQGGWDNVTLTAAVPEPASWAMLIIGFGLTGAAARRRRSPTVAA
jgi:hypothetical protein